MTQKSRKEQAKKEKYSSKAKFPFTPFFPVFLLIIYISIKYKIRKGLSKKLHLFSTKKHKKNSPLREQRIQKVHTFAAF